MNSSTAIDQAGSDLIHPKTFATSSASNGSFSGSCSLFDGASFERESVHVGGCSVEYLRGKWVHHGHEQGARRELATRDCWMTRFDGQKSAVKVNGKDLCLQPLQGNFTLRPDDPGHAPNFNAQLRSAKKILQF